MAATPRPKFKKITFCKKPRHKVYYLAVLVFFAPFAQNAEKLAPLAALGAGRQASYLYLGIFDGRSALRRFGRDLAMPKLSKNKKTTKNNRIRSTIWLILLFCAARVVDRPAALRHFGPPPPLGGLAATPRPK